jgi:hypothetical protein
MHFDRRFGDASRLSRMRTDQAKSGQGKSDLVAKLRAPKLWRQSRPAAPRVVARRPARTVLLAEQAPSVSVKLSSSPTDGTKQSPAIRALVNCIRRSAVDQFDRVAFSWPERVRNPLAATLLAALALHEDHPDGSWTLAFLSPSNRLKYDSRRLFADETELAPRAFERMRHDTGVVKGAVWYFDYLLRGTASVQKRPNRRGNPVTSPCLYELVPVFEIPDGAPRRRYPARAANFLVDIERKKELLKHAPTAATCASEITKAPTAIFRLPCDASEVGQVVQATPRLKSCTDVVVIDFTREIAMNAKTVMASLRKLKRAFEVPDGRPAFVIACSDPFLAQRCREILANEGDNAPTKKVKEIIRQAPNVSSVRLEVNVHAQPSDFSYTNVPSFGTDVPTARATVRNDGMTQFRRRWTARAHEMDLMGWAEGAHAIRRGIAFAAKIAALPVGYANLIKSVEAAEEERGLNPWLSSQYKLTALAADLQRAAGSSDGYGHEIKILLDEIVARILPLRNSTEISECVRELLDQATKKSNRTIFVLASELILEALQEHVLAGGFEALDVDKIRKKVIFTTPADLDPLLLDCWKRGPQADTLVIVQPSIKGIQRIVVAPRLPRKVLLIGDATALHQAERHISDVGDLLPTLAGRTTAICTAIHRAVEQYTNGPELDLVARPYSDATLIDFSQDETGTSDAGPRVMITTASGYRLRYRTKGDCIVHQDDLLSPFRKVQAGTVEPGDGILIMTGRLQERLDHLLGPVAAGDDTFLRLYRQEIQNRVAALPQSTLRRKAAALLETMRASAAVKQLRSDQIFGKHAVSNVTRWLSAHVDDGTRQPRAPKSIGAFACFTEALGMNELIAAQFWENSIKRVRIENMQAGTKETARALGFLLNPHGFYQANPHIKDSLIGLFGEMTRSFDEIVSSQLERDC